MTWAIDRKCLELAEKGKSRQYLKKVFDTVFKLPWNSNIDQDTLRTIENAPKYLAKFDDNLQPGSGIIPFISPRTIIMGDWKMDSHVEAA